MGQFFSRLDPFNVLWITVTAVITCIIMRIPEFSVLVCSGKYLKPESRLKLLSVYLNGAGKIFWFEDYLTMGSCRTINSIERDVHKWPSRIRSLVWHEVIYNCDTGRIIAIIRDIYGKRRDIIKELFPECYADLILSYVFRRIPQRKRKR